MADNRPQLLPALQRPRRRRNPNARRPRRPCATVTRPRARSRRVVQMACAVPISSPCFKRIPQLHLTTPNDLSILHIPDGLAHPPAPLITSPLSRLVRRPSFGRLLSSTHSARRFVFPLSSWLSRPPQLRGAVLLWRFVWVSQHHMVRLLAFGASVVCILQSGVGRAAWLGGNVPSHAGSG